MTIPCQRLLRIRFHLSATRSGFLLSCSAIEVHKPRGSLPVEELFMASLTLLMMTSSSSTENAPCCSDWLLICFHVCYQVDQRSSLLWTMHACMKNEWWCCSIWSTYLAWHVLPVHLLRDSTPVDRWLACVSSTTLHCVGVGGVSQHELLQLIILFSNYFSINCKLSHRCQLLSST